MKHSQQTDPSETRASLPQKSFASVPFWMWGAVAALLIFAGYISWETIQITKSIKATNAQATAEITRHHELEEKLGLARRQAVIMTDPRSVKIPLAADDKNMPKLEAFWHPKLGIVVSAQNIPAPSGTRTLQLWLIPKAPGSKPLPSLTLRPDADGKFVLLVADPPFALDATKALAITEEPAGGSPQPAAKPIWLGAVN